ncbi:MAG TPA: Gfo/Idh/MocA family oxidoreductase [Candidatus Hydrogenedentes bacterium]|nr:Gfo/Idh/MocA family oxidoreductase [Candidatus Hydrogenedentota bacterium]
MKVALIGCSGMGNVHAQMATNCGLKVSVFADKNIKIAKAIAKQYKGEAITDGMAACERTDIDIVAIATPTPTHLMFVKAAANAGKHIFCEKPFCRTASECKEAIAAAKKAKVKLFVGHVVRYFQEFEAMKTQIAAGKIGEPGFAKLYRGGLLPMGSESWFRDFEKSGGVTFDCMIHDLDWLRYVFGEPERIFCQALMYTKRVPFDYSQVTLRMKSGLIATVIGTWAHPHGFQVKAEICGSGGMIQFNSNEAPMAAMKREVKTGPDWALPSSPVDISPYQLEWEDFIGWIRDTRTPRVTAHDALRAVQMVEAALQSAKTGRPVAL